MSLRLFSIKIAALSVLLAGGLASHPAVAAGVKCALSNTVGTGNRDIDYSARGDRCEGVFQRQVATSLGMQLIGFQLGQSPADAYAMNDKLAVRVLVRSADVLLRATGTLPQTNYVLDTDKIAPDGLFSWDSSILAHPSLRMTSDRLALLACSNSCRPTAETTYFPVEPLHPKALRAGAYEVSIRAQRDISSLSYKVTQGNSVLAKGDKQGPMSSSRPVRIALPKLKPGVYKLTVYATSAGYAADNLVAQISIPQ